MPTCPAGHDSADDEFCDVCGREMDGPAPAAAAGSSAPAAVSAPDAPPAGATCQACGAPLAGRFCEACGHDSLTAPPAAPPTPPEPVPVPARPADRLPDGTAWTATVSADRTYYDTVMAAEGPDAGRIGFPPFCPDRHFPLQGKQISIGRQSRSRGISPDIDLTGPPEDPGVSHLHALLVAQPDGSWAVVDLDSANGVSVNDEPNPLRPNAPRPLVDGDRCYLGAWTRITLRLSR
ncbi:MAG: FHA domain-containing protein [Actinophytocola sp.]|uniref:FHA domain-containing protein n=1 Tax=Actinophytocola sp. TaxID=1872138 RepID=UPI00132A3BAF|nr:FHA domain-containing protein [Actinophytocola sp.]MPZ83238.1 FHA domain-containing protein [Actinophytocola sp.]